MFGFPRIAFAFTLLAVGVTATSFADENKSSQALPVGIESTEFAKLLATMRSQITDLTAKVTRLEKQLKESTRNRSKHATKIKMYPLQHADAKQAVVSVAPLFGAEASSPTMIAFDARTNTVLARGRAEELEMFGDFLFQLDQPTKDPKLK